MNQRTACVSVTLALVVLALTSACTSQTAGTGAELGGPAAAVSSAGRPAGQPSASSASTARADALGAILEGVALKDTDLADGYAITLAPQGDEVAGQVTLDNCGYDFTSEADRVARRQYNVLTTAGEATGATNELVAYDSSTDASLAMTQWLKSVLTCPTTPVRSNVAGVPDLTMTVILNEYQNAEPLPNRVNDLTIESATVDGQTEYLLAVQQIHGRYLDSVYEQLSVSPDITAINGALALATITGALRVA